MVNVQYNFNGKNYALGGLINGEINNTIVTSPGEADIYDFTFENGKTISLSVDYGMIVVTEDGNFSISVNLLKIGQNIMMTDITESSKITSISVRKGKNILFPKRQIKFNDIFVFLDNYVPINQLDLSVQNEKHSTCKFRSEEKITKEVKTSCCSAPTNVTEYLCNKKEIQLTQPICWNCELYEKK